MITASPLSPARMVKAVRIPAFLLGAAVLQQSHAQLSVAPQPDVQALAAAISGPGVTISNPAINCHVEGFGEFTYSGTQLGLSEGVILTTGRRDNAVGPNNSGSLAFNAARPGSPILNIVTGRTTFDQCKLEFDVIPAGDSLKFNFSFGSEEYNEWVGSQFNDVFGFFISGPGITGDPGIGSDHNIALIPGSSQPVTINNVNNGSNSQYYHDNTGGSHVQYDGFTQNLSAVSAVQPCQSYHLKLIVADATDNDYDSGVLIERVQSNPVTIEGFTQSGGPDLIEGCNNGWVRFTRSNVSAQPLALTYFLQGTATNGADYQAIAPVNPALPKSITIPANAAYVDRPFTTVVDALPEPTESIRLILGNPNCPAMALDTVTMSLVDTLISSVTPVFPGICLGSSVQFNTTGGTSWAWSPATGLSATNIPNPIATPTTTTNYQVVISDAQGCSRTIRRTVRVSNMALSATVTDVLCNGGTNGAINLTVAGGLAPFSYAWTGPGGFTAATQDITNRPAGTYTVNVTDAACTRSQSFTIGQPNVLNVSLAPTVLAFGNNIACNGASTGLIDGTITGGTSPFSVSWSGPGGFTSTNIDINGLAAGNYSVTVTDFQGCVRTAGVTLTQSAVLNASITTFSNVTCNGANNGSATVTRSGGTPPYTYSWNTSPVQTGQTATNLPPGTYTVTVTDAYGCTRTASRTITQPASAISSVLVSQTNVLCRNANTGAASVSASGGTTPYTYSWNTSPVQNSASATNMPAGTFTCTITDANGCQTTRSVTITQPATGINTSIASQQNVSCFGGNNGSATVSASGGNPPYTYSWNTSPVQTGASVSGRPAGAWICTVTDASGCTATRSVTITQPASTVSGFITSVTNNSCFGQTGGSATAAASGGTPPYTYSWNTAPVQNSATVVNRLAGTYTCTITDANGCSTTVDAVISSPPQLVGTILSDTDVACFGQNTGAATVGASGGSGTYTYTWNTSPPQTGTSATNIPYGVYTATVTDGNGCSTTAEVTISQPASPLGTSATVSPASCGGPNTGAVNATTTGGTPPYTFSWSGPNGFTSSSEDINSLAAGVYTLLATDANGCLRSTVWNVNQPGLFTITGVLSDFNGYNVGCRNGNNGSIDVTVTGSNPPFSYSWTGPGGFTATTEDISGRPAGNYTFTVTNALNCSNAMAFTLTQPPGLFNNLTATNVGNGYNVSCFGGSNGAVTSARGGGVSPYSSAWTGPGGFTSTAQNIGGRPAGTYTQTITDANGCSLSTSITLTQPIALSASIGVNNHVMCRNGSSGRATVNASGGVAPYSFSWNTTPVQTGGMATGLAAGNYTCTVTDANGCTTTSNVTITQPAAVLSATTSTQTDVLCRGDATGSATASATGGTAPYSYSWNTSPVQTGATAINLAAGTRQCTVTDANGCTFVLSVTITQPAQSMSGSFIDNVDHVSCFSANDGSARANGAGGTPGYTYSWNTTPVQTTQTATGLASGSYSCTITDANGCTRIRTVTINGPSAGLSASISAQSNELCGGMSSGTGSATVSITGGTAPYTRSWNTSPVQTGATATNLQNGTYTCSVTDANGCTTSVNVTITEPTPIGNDLVNLTQVTCNGAHDGTATVQGTGGTAPYSYLWNSGATTATVPNLYPGNYTCWVRDANNCESVRSITITQPTALFASASTQTASCQGVNSGAVNLTVSGGTPPYSYAWTGDNGYTASTQDISGLLAGAYSVIVTDANGCSFTGTWNVTDPGSFTITHDQDTMANGLSLLCNGGNNAWITTETRGGQQPYSYSWSGPGGYTSVADDISGLVAGNYVFTVTDANGCSTSATYTLTQPAAFVSGVIGVNAGNGFNITCFGGSNGATSGNVTGGNSPLAYAWSGPGAFSASTANITGRPAGTYNLGITDAFGCPFNTSVVLTQPPALSATASVNAHVLCRNASSGSATAAAAGGVAPYSYSWNTTPAQSGPLATNLPAGSWTCTVTDANGCTTSTAVTITQPATVLSASASTAPVQCFGGATGSATASASGGTPNYTYAWNTTPVQTTATAVGLAAGSYTCTVADANGCATTAIANVSEPSAALGGSITAQTNVNCFGNNTGSASATASGGTAPYLYSWNTTPGQNNATANALPAGTWSCTITDARGCVAVVQATITQPAAPLGTSIASRTNVGCFGNNTGTATIAVSGGTPGYAYSWNTTPVQTSATATGLSAGNHTCTVVDAVGCSTSINVVITQPAAALSAIITSQVNVSCTGDASGSAQVGVTGGTAPFSYAWNTSPVQNTVQATNLATGNYTCTVTDANGCSTSATVVITQPAAAVTASVSSQTNVACFGNNTGGASVSANGGTGGYSFLWNTTPAQSGATAMNMAAGAYQCTVTDGNGCTTVVNVAITQPAAALAAMVSSQNNVLCHGDASGSATVNVNGGTTPYALAWDTFPVQTTTTATSLFAGPHACLITDANGCTVQTTATITQPASAIGVTATVTPAACQGAANGGVNITTNGGTGAYAFQWSGPNSFTATTEDITGIPAGVYNLVVTDANGCSNTTSWNVNQPGLFTLNSTAGSYAGGVNVSCQGATDGSINMTVSGATAPYTYAWSGPNSFSSTSEDITGLAAGSYTFIVTDANGCSTSQSFTLTAPSPFNIALSAADEGNGFNVSCNGGSNGSIAATTSGGIAPLGHSWSGPSGFSANTQDVTSLIAGTYTLTITDANGCTATSNILLSEPTALSAAAQSTASVLCHGGNTGAANGTISGGVAPYQYQWNTSPIQNTQAASALSTGNWTMSVTDANGCSTTTSVNIAEPAAALALSITALTDVLCFGNSTGAATSEARDGTAPYTYSWNTTPVQTSATATGLAAGTYTCTATDANGCTANVNATISQPASSVAAAITSNDPVSCHGGTDGSAVAIATGGTGSYSYMWNSAPVQANDSLIDVSTGAFAVTITDANGCTASASTIITEPAAPLSAGVASITHQDCFGSTNGSVTVNANGGTAPYTFSWNTSPVQTNATAIGLAAGTYTATIRDARDCMTTVTVIINGPSAALGVAVVSSTDVLCFGASTGAATAEAHGGTAPYSYLWNTTPTITAPSIADQPAGAYTVQVIDANGCTTSANITIDQPLAPMDAFLEDVHHVDCHGGYDGYATIDITGGSGSYSVVWNTFPTQTGNTVTGLAAGNYQAQITDNNGCPNSKFFIVTIEEPTASLAVTGSAHTYGGGYNTTCSYTNDGLIDATVSGGTLPYTYAWTEPFGATLTTQDLAGLSAGAYDLQVTDANGCTAQFSTTLNAPATIDITSTVVPAACQGAATGSINTNPLGGVAPYVLAWSGPNGFTASTVDIANLVAGVYTLNITDANGCANAFPLDVNQPGLFSTSALLSSYNGGHNVSCAGATDGSIDATIAGGTPGYTYSWSGPNGFGSTSEDLNNVAAGTYNLTITDANGCSTLATWSLLSPAPLNVGVAASMHDVNNISCAGGNDGAIDATIFGGTAPYMIAWTGPNALATNTEDISTLSAGSYDVSITDANACSTTASIVLTEPAPLATSVSTIVQANGDNISCNAFSDGGIDLSISGGHAPYSVLWSGPNAFSSTAQDNNGLPAGTYTATITDATGCTTSLSVTLTEPTALLATSTLSSYVGGAAISCNGMADGSIDLTATGGAGNLQFAWTGDNAFVSTTEDVNDLPAGQYQVTVTDQNGCTAQQTALLFEPEAMTATATVRHINCFGGNTGQLNAQVEGGTAPYDLLWSGPGAYSANTLDITSLYSGVYVLNITDANGCTHVQPFNVNETDAFTITTTTSQYAGGYHVSCAGEMDGSIDAAITGGTAPYYHQWTGPSGFSAITEDIDSLSAGYYFLIITDQNGCQGLAEQTLVEPTPINIGLVADLYNGAVNTTCSSTPDGSIDAIVAGGDQPYTYSWTGPNGFVSASEDLTGLAAGDYTLTITDAIGCGTSASITLVEPTPVNSSATAATQNGGASTSCNGGADGSIDLTVDGGTQPYMIAWSGPSDFGSNNEDLTGLMAGDYTAVITDANGCTSTTSITLTAPSVIDIQLSASQFSGGYNIPCNGLSVATINAAISGGSSGYTYSWSSSSGFISMDEDLSGVPAGEYTLTVTDVNGCTGIASINLTQPAVLDATSQVGTTGNGYEVSCAGNDGSIDLATVGGTSPYQFAWFSTNGFASQDEDVDSLFAGSYTVTITDDNGCTYGDTLLLTAPDQLDATITTGPVVCNGASDGTIDLEVTGGASALTYAWSGPNGFTATTQDLMGLAGGDYSVTVSDNGNCTATWTTTLLASSAMVADVYRSDYGSVNIPCFGDSTGVIEVAITGGVQPLTAAWTGPNGFTSSSLELSGLIAGDYHLSIVDGNGCSMDSTIVLTHPTAALAGYLSAALFPSGTNVACAGGNDGSIDATVVGGTAPYIFDWRGPDSTSFSTEDISGLVAGEYTLVVIDSNACATTMSITLDQPDSTLIIPTLSLFNGGFNTTCDGSTDGSIGVQVSGGNGAHTYSWQGPGGFTSDNDTITSLAEGTYSLTTTDLNGCTTNASIELISPEPISPTLLGAAFPSGSNISCAGVADGSITAGIVGGTPDYALSWSGPNGFTSTNDSLQGLIAGEYCVTVSDVNGCATQTCITLTEPATLSVSATSTNADCGQATGTIDANVLGGSAPYTYAWSNGSTNEDLTQVGVNDYDVVVTDLNGCTVMTTAAVTGAPAITGDAALGDAFCNAASDGSIDLTMINGTAPYQFSWTGGADTEDVTGLPAGSFQVQVTDDAGCSWSAVYTINEPAPIAVDSLVFIHPNGFQVSALGATDGSIAVEATGGTAPYTYVWSTGATGSAVEGLGEGTYTVTITDANGCTRTLEFNLDAPNDIEMPTGYTPNRDGHNDTFVIHGLEAYPQNQLLVFNRWGNLVYDRINYTNDWAGENMQGDHLPNGTYFVILRLNSAETNLQGYVDLRR